MQYSHAKTKKCQKTTSDLDLVIVHTRENSLFVKCQRQLLCRLCVEHVEEAAKESALFFQDEGSEQMSVDITGEVEALFKALNLPDADVDDVHDCL